MDLGDRLPGFVFQLSQFGCVTQDKLFNLSELHFAIYTIWRKYAYLPGGED